MNTQTISMSGTTVVIRMESVDFIRINHFVLTPIIIFPEGCFPLLIRALLMLNVDWE